jgi:hypothetical protein
VIDIINKNTETLIDASKEVGLEVNVEKSKYMLVSRHQNEGQNLALKIANRLFRKCARFSFNAVCCLLRYSPR